MEIDTSRRSVPEAVAKEAFMTTDNGNGIKYVMLIILASISLFVVGGLLAYVGDDLRTPAWNSYSVPAPSTR